MAGGWGKKIASLYADVGVKTDGLEKGLTGVKGSLEGLAKSFLPAMTAAGLLTGAVALAKKAFEFSLEGAQLEQLQLAGERLATSMGANMDEIVDKVGKAARGMVSNSDIMASANKALMLQVTTDADEMATLMEIAAMNAQVMGITTVQAFDDIIRGLGRGSAPILDNLGIILDSKAAYEDYAKSIGKSTDALTKDEQKRAITVATIEEGNRLIKETGGLIETTAGKWERAQAAEKNYWDAVKTSQTGIASLWATTKTNVYEALTERMELQNKIETLSKANFLNDKQRKEAIVTLERRGAGALKEYLDALIGAGNTEEDVLRRLGFTLEGTVIDTEKLTGSFLAYKQSVDDAIGKTEDFGVALSGIDTSLFSTLNKYAVDLYDTQTEIAEKQEEINVLATGYDLSGAEVSAEDAKARIIELKGEIEALQDNIKAMNDSIILDMIEGVITADGIVTDAEYASYLAMQVKMGIISQEIANQMMADADGFIAYWEGLQIADKNGNLNIYIKYHDSGVGANLDYENYTGPTYGNAAGGYISAGMPAIVGEEGIELIVPNASSYVVAHDQLDEILNDGDSKAVTNYYYTLNMPTTANAEDVASVFELIRAFGGN